MDELGRFLFDTAFPWPTGIAGRSYGDVRVHADALVPLEGRPMARLMDPAADLASIADGFGASWILPAPDAPAPEFAHALAQLWSQRP